jgi:hypothetical protein
LTAWFFQFLPNPRPIAHCPMPNPITATYGLSGEDGSVVVDVLERVPLSDEEPLEIGRHFAECYTGILVGSAILNLAFHSPPWAELHQRDRGKQLPWVVGFKKLSDSIADVHDIPSASSFVGHPRVLTLCRFRRTILHDGLIILSLILLVCRSLHKMSHRQYKTIYHRPALTVSRTCTYHCMIQVIIFD